MAQPRAGKEDEAPDPEDQGRREELTEPPPSAIAPRVATFASGLVAVALDVAGHCHGSLGERPREGRTGSRRVIVHVGFSSVPSDHADGKQRQLFWISSGIGRDNDELFLGFG